MPLLEQIEIKQTITNMNNIMDLIDFERRGEYVLADVKSATWFIECMGQNIRSKIFSTFLCLRGCSMCQVSHKAWIWPKSIFLPTVKMCRNCVQNLKIIKNTLFEISAVE
jgi:hypothetical protein